MSFAQQQLGLLLLCLNSTGNAQHDSEGSGSDLGPGLSKQHNVHDVCQSSIVQRLSDSVNSVAVLRLPDVHFYFFGCSTILGYVTVTPLPSRARST